MAKINISCLFLIFILISCSNATHVPDKSVAGGLSGAGWGSVAGAVVGKQLSVAGEGAVVGAGLGLLEGAVTGGAIDQLEFRQGEQQEALAALKIRTNYNREKLRSIQYRLDRALAMDMFGGVYQVFFDIDTTSLQAGATQSLKLIAQSLANSAYNYKVIVLGHSSDEGNQEYNQKLSLARAKEVSSFLVAHGVERDRIEVKAYGSTMPIASNMTPVGRQLNRRVDLYIVKNQ